MRNQGTTAVYAKVNTNCAGVVNYLREVENFTGLVGAYPDTFYLSICGNKDYLYAVNNTYIPPANVTTANLIIPIYLGPNQGINTISIPITMSSVDVTTSRYISSSPLPFNRVEWEIYKRNGWPTVNYDGNIYSQTGMSTYANYIYNGNVSSALTTSMSARASIRYEYINSVAGSSLYLHLTTEEMLAASNIRIVP